MFIVSLHRLSKMVRACKRDVRSANDVRTLRTRINQINDTTMKAELIIPIDSLRGALRKDGYYFRVCKGEQIVQRCPRKWTDTPARKAAREKFIAKYGKSKRTQNDPKKNEILVVCKICTTQEKW